MSLSIDIASSATEELLIGLNNLVPQLSTSAAPLTIGDVEALIANPAVSVFVAKNDGAIVVYGNPENNQMNVAIAKI